MEDTINIISIQVVFTKFELEWAFDAAPFVVEDTLIWYDSSSDHALSIKT